MALMSILVRRKGICFEVAMTRDKFPEKIPFRLTRMLINAMEVTGIEGTYRSTCESVMRVLRNNKDSLMAVLEAFVYDPLLNWRLMEGAAGVKSKKAKKEQPAPAAPTAPLPTPAVQAMPAAGAAGAYAPVAVAARTVGAKDAPPSSAAAAQAADGAAGGGGGDSSNSTAANSTATESVAEQAKDGATAAAANPAPNPAPPTVELDNLLLLDANYQPEALNRKALDIIQRVRDKLTGRDFSREETLDIAEQVDRLIEQATNNENLCQSYIGWCPFW